MRPKKTPFFLLAPLRLWHRWLGMGAALFLLVIATTGVVLNHRNLLFASAMPAKAEGGRKPGLTTALDPSRLLSPDEVLKIAREQLGSKAAIDSLSLAQGPGGLVWQLRSPRQADPGFELAVDARSGTTELKTKTGYQATDAKGHTTFDWGRLAMDLHTGKFWHKSLGPWLFSDLAAISLWLLTVSGLCLRALPKWRKHCVRPATLCRTTASLAPAPTV